MNASTRQEATDKGLSKYYTGKPCIRGHVDERYTRSGHCVGCRREQGRIRGAKMRKDPKIIAYQKAYQAKYRLTEKGAAALAKANAKHRQKKASEDDS